MEISTRWHRLLRAAAFAAGLAVGLGAAVFMFSNVAPVAVHWRIPGATRPVLDWTGGVSLWVVGVVPLLVGLAAGYLYHLPARLHHLRQHLHHRHRVHELEHEVRELRASLDKLVLLPDDRLTAEPISVPAPAAAEPEGEKTVVLKLPEPVPALARERRRADRPRVIGDVKVVKRAARAARPTAETSS